MTLYAWEHDDALIVVGSLGGAPSDPAWAVNLRATPLATVVRGGTAQPVRARELSGDERAGAWATAVERFPMYARFQARTDRQIPIFRLDPAEA